MFDSLDSNEERPEKGNRLKTDDSRPCFPDTQGGRNAENCASNRARKPCCSLHLPNVSSQTRGGAAPSLSVMLWMGSLSFHVGGVNPRPDNRREQENGKWDEVENHL
ncbi:MAG TPA: hypothetical protein PLQ52_08870, partial [Lacunisphaera sp.]|nr:hypothetical protein [Lacunisphaera sp.]